MPRKTGINLADDAARARLKPRSSAYSNPLGPARAVLYYVGTKRRTWRGRAPGIADVSLGHDPGMTFVEAVAALEKLEQEGTREAGDVDTRTATIGDAWDAYMTRAEATRARARSQRSGGTGG